MLRSSRRRRTCQAIYLFPFFTGLTSACMSSFPLMIFPFQLTLRVLVGSIAVMYEVFGTFASVNGGSSTKEDCSLHPFVFCLTSSSRGSGFITFFKIVGLCRTLFQFILWKADPFLLLSLRLASASGINILSSWSFLACMTNLPMNLRKSSLPELSFPLLFMVLFIHSLRACSLAGCRIWSMTICPFQWLYCHNWPFSEIGDNYYGVTPPCRLRLILVATC